jgi:hypothetical protein
MVSIKVFDHIFAHKLTLKFLGDHSLTPCILFFSLLDTLKPFLIIIINYICLSDATIRVLIFQRLL